VFLLYQRGQEDTARLALKQALQAQPECGAALASVPFTLRDALHLEPVVKCLTATLKLRPDLMALVPKLAEGRIYRAVNLLWDKQDPQALHAASGGRPCIGL
jgi:hypothetical protein